MTKILVALKNETDNKLISRLLEDRYEFIRINELNDNKRKIDLVIIGINFLKETYEILLSIRKDINPISLPVLLVTKDAKIDLPNNFHKVVDDILIIPVTKSNFILKVESLLRQRNLSLLQNKLNNELTSLNAELKNANIINEKLIGDLENTKAELIELNNTKDKFFSIIAHDLRNPFSSLMGFSELLNDNFDNYEKQDIAKMIGYMHITINSTFNLLENLLTWSRSQLGVLKFFKESTSIFNLISEVVHLNKITASEKNINLRYNVPENCTWKVDSIMISTVLRNLIANSIKFTMEHGTIDVKAYTDSNYLYISVIDTGIGMSQESVGKLFKIQESFSTQGTNNEKGTGLGLILCKDFIEKHNGSINVYSEINKGTKMEIVIPK